MLLAYHVVETPAGRIEAVKPNPAVPVKVLRDIKAAKESGATDGDWIQMLRVKTVPPGYTPQPWSSMCCSQSYFFFAWTLYLTLFWCYFVDCTLTYPFYSPGERKENQEDMLRAILAQMEYQYQVEKWVAKGVPFSLYLYVPEIHPITEEEFHEREDFAHVLKVKDCIHVSSMCILCKFTYLFVTENGPVHTKRRSH